MAVYTRFDAREFTDFIADYDIGNVITCQDIEGGVSNTNYLVKTDKYKLVLTLYEARTDADAIPFAIAFMQHLARKKFPCPAPVSRRDSGMIGNLAGRPATLIHFLRGEQPENPGISQCYAAGAMLAQMHLHGLDFPLMRANGYGLNKWQILCHEYYEQADGMDPFLQDVIRIELDFIQHHWPQDLPIGVIHADYFPDNTLFEQDNLSGVIDFNFACTDFLAYDLAISMNAWGNTPQNGFSEQKAKALLLGYESLRPLTPKESQSLPILCRGAAMRFLSTRLYDSLKPVTDGVIAHPKDPMDMFNLLQYYRNNDIC